MPTDKHVPKVVVGGGSLGVNLPSAYHASTPGYHAFLPDETGMFCRGCGWALALHIDGSVCPPAGNRGPTDVH